MLGNSGMLMGMLKGKLSGMLTLEGMLEGTLIELGMLVMMLIKSLMLGESLTLREMLEVSEMLRGTTGVVLWMVQARRRMLDISLMLMGMPACSGTPGKLPTASWPVDNTVWVLGEVVWMKSFKKVWPASSTRSHRAMQMLNGTTWYLDLLSLPVHRAGWSLGAFGPISKGTMDAQTSTVSTGAWPSLDNLAFSCSGWCMGWHGVTLVGTGMLVGMAPDSAQPKPRRCAAKLSLDDFEVF